jgi:hypothetical protein
VTTADSRFAPAQPSDLEPHDGEYRVEPWEPRRTEGLERDHRAREAQPLKDYFQRMQERGLLE